MARLSGSLRPVAAGAGHYERLGFNRGPLPTSSFPQRSSRMVRCDVDDSFHEGRSKERRGHPHWRGAVRLGRPELRGRRSCLHLKLNPRGSCQGPATIAPCGTSAQVLDWLALLAVNVMNRRLSCQVMSVRMNSSPCQTRRYSIHTKKSLIRLSSGPPCEAVSPPFPGRSDLRGYTEMDRNRPQSDLQCAQSALVHRHGDNVWVAHGWPFA